MDQLSGVIMLTDGRDHSRTDVQQSIGSFARQTIPLNSVVIGSQEPICDADIISLDAPLQIYHGDSVSLQATLRADQLKGSTAPVRLYEDDNLLDERSVNVASDKHRESIRFLHEPKVARIHRYRLELSALDGEESTDNNSASCNVWVSNDQIRVLLIEDRPRWEFRYLRNLFAGRDRTVFLQAVLLHRIDWQEYPFRPPFMRLQVEHSMTATQRHCLAVKQSGSSLTPLFWVMCPPSNWGRTAFRLWRLLCERRVARWL